MGREERDEAVEGTGVSGGLNLNRGVSILRERMALDTSGDGVAGIDKSHMSWQGLFQGGFEKGIVGAA